MPPGIRKASTDLSKERSDHMPIAQNVSDMLKKSGVAYEVMKHPQAFTAQEVAAAVHVTGKEVAKTLVVNADGKYVMATIPAPHKLNLRSLKELLKAKEVRFATEQELESLFPECEVGAMPPFGNLYNMPVIASSALKDRPEIVFNACSHTEVIKIAYADFERLVQPKVGDISALPPESVN
jgi:Ala-tRNA(Pro) deacylase